MTTNPVADYDVEADLPETRHDGGVLVPGFDPPLWIHPGRTPGEPRPARVPAPWTPEQVCNAIAWQDSPALDAVVRCPNDARVLGVHRDGFMCGGCGHIQDWAWAAQVNDTPTGTGSGT